MQAKNRCLPLIDIDIEGTNLRAWSENTAATQKLVMPAPEPESREAAKDTGILSHRLIAPRRTFF